MADKVIKSFALKNLQCSIPEGGQYPEMETGTSGKEYIGLPPYEYEPLQSSLQEHGYDPESFDYIVATSEGKVLYGGRRVWLMQNEMGLDQETMIDCEIWTQEEFMAELKKRMNHNVNPNLFSKRSADGTITPATALIKRKLYKAGFPNMKERHKSKPKPYSIDDYVLENGTKLSDALKEI